MSVDKPMRLLDIVATINKLVMDVADGETSLKIKTLLGQLYDYKSPAEVEKMIIEARIDEVQNYCGELVAHDEVLNDKPIRHLILRYEYDRINELKGDK